MFIQYFYFHYLLQYYHYSLPPYSEDITLILYQFLSVALYHFTSVANNEGIGISKTAVERSNICINIPMYGIIESLN